MSFIDKIFPNPLPTIDEIEKTYGSKYLDRAKIKEKIGN